MRRIGAIATLVLLCGTAAAADLDLHRKAPPPADRPAAADPSVPQRLQSSEPGTPTQPGKPPAADDSRLDTLGKPEDSRAPVDESWWQKLVRSAPGCKSFSDGCRVCSTGYVCSNVGIACQPREWACNDPKP